MYVEKIILQTDFESYLDPRLANGFSYSLIAISSWIPYGSFHNQFIVSN